MIPTYMWRLYNVWPECDGRDSGHPILPALREQVYQYNAPVHIGRNCWIGAGAVIVPGVSIGDETVIGAGSVVTKRYSVGRSCRGEPV